MGLRMRCLVSRIDRRACAQYSWLLVSLFTRIVATSAFIPIVTIMFEAMNCKHVGSGALVWSEDPAVRCWQDESLALGLCALAVLLVYVPLCVRFFRVRKAARVATLRAEFVLFQCMCAQVGGNIAAIEVKLNPFEWAHDDTSEQAPLHALSSTDGRYDLYGVGVRGIMTAMSVRMRIW